MADEQEGGNVFGWPGNIWLEGRTIVHLQPDQERPSHMPRGPAKKPAVDFSTQLWLLHVLALFYC